MLKWRALMVCATVCVSALSIGQGSAGGFGGGMGGAGGGFGGGGVGGGNFGEQDDSGKNKANNPLERNPDQDNAQALWTDRTAILTPGDRVEFKFKLKKGEVLLAAASSTAFDPALRVEDKDGKGLLEVDDRAEGEQSPFISFRAPAEGEYLLKVLSFRSVAGGQFTVRFRTFEPADKGYGPQTYESLPSQPFQGQMRYAVRLPAKKGDYVVLPPSLAVNSASGYARLVQFVGPSGLQKADVEFIDSPHGTIALALRDGDYYAEYLGNYIGQINSNFHIAQSERITTKSKASLELKEGEVKIAEYPVQQGQVVRTKIESKMPLLHQASGPMGPSSARGEDHAFGHDYWSTYFKLNIGSDKDMIRIHHGTGIVRVALYNSMRGTTKVDVINSEDLPEILTNKPISSPIGIGDSKVYILKSTKSELMRMDVSADTFQPTLDIFHLNGGLANSLTVPASKSVGDDLYFPEAGTFLVRVSCEGYGGSGNFQLSRKTAVAEPVELSKTLAVKLDGKSIGLNSVRLEAGTRYEIIVPSASPLRVDLINPEGQFLNGQWVQFDTVRQFIFVPAKSGDFRIWLRGPALDSRLVIRKNSPPKIDGV